MKHAAVLMTLVGDHSVIPLDDDVRPESKEFYLYKKYTALALYSKYLTTDLTLCSISYLV